MAVKMVLKYVLLVLVALIALSFLAETVIYMVIIYMSVRSSMDDKSVYLPMFLQFLVAILRNFVPLSFLSMYVLGWYAIFKEHFLFSVTFSLVLCFIATVSYWYSSAVFFELVFNSFSGALKFIAPQPLIFGQIIMFLRVAGVTVLPAMILFYTIMIRKKTPVEGSIMLDDVRPPEWRQNEEDVTNIKQTPKSFALISCDFSCDRLWWRSLISQRSTRKSKTSRSKGKRLSILHIAS